ncbi:hypothetical protein M501DRAFT_407433 [Patellaria atrata CBS 101060]|uniref:Uncharacterized protein n=1 Tax=Patellaria atrata CBS 101060 TaxID=1346257 RepID=A0A9P4SIC1_9PEZI|nr:hypothetical protein M501DRAFT_407433 [Patellaria atrata CBS 101060]
MVEIKGPTNLKDAQPPSMPSPTLTNPDMILPSRFDENMSEYGGSQFQAERPPSVSDYLQHRRNSRSSASTPSTTRSATTPTADQRHDQTTPTMQYSRGYTLASSPTLRDTPPNGAVDNLNGERTRRLSNSSSLNSEELEELDWSQFESSTDIDEAEGPSFERNGSLSGPTRVDGDNDSPQHDFQTVDDEEEDGDAEMRRFEAHLAEAKKRVEMMGSNIKGVRESMVTTSPSLGSLRTSFQLSARFKDTSDLHKQVLTGRDRMYSSSPRYSTIGSSPLSSSPLSSSGSPQHGRVSSETSVPSPLARLPLRVNTPNTRSFSALGMQSTGWTSPITHNRKEDVSRSDKFGLERKSSIERRVSLTSPTMPHHDDAEYDESGLRIFRLNSVRSSEHPLRQPKASPTPPPALEPVLEEESPSKTLRRSSSLAVGSVTETLEKLNRKVSSLRESVQADRLKRRSMQSLRTPSPFTDAEAWKSSSVGHQSQVWSPGATPSFGTKEPSPIRHEYQDGESLKSPQSIKEELKPSIDPIPQTEHTVNGEEETDETKTTDVSVVNYDDIYDTDSSAASVYEDAEDEHFIETAAERHEDRPDAFDYQNFFLHSAMGTYSRQGRRSSLESSSSVETARVLSPVRPPSSDSVRTAYYEPPTEMIKPGKSSRPTNGHSRNGSALSVSTMATFETAMEGSDSEPGSPANSDPEIIPMYYPLGDAPFRLDMPSKLVDELLKPVPANYHIRAKREIQSAADKQLLHDAVTNIQKVAISFSLAHTDDLATWRSRLHKMNKILNGEE